MSSQEGLAPSYCTYVAALAPWEQLPQVCAKQPKLERGEWLATPTGQMDRGGGWGSGLQLIPLN